MELADVLDSKSSGSDTVSVRPRPPAPNTKGRGSPLPFVIGGSEGKSEPKRAVEFILVVRPLAARISKSLRDYEGF